MAVEDQYVQYIDFVYCQIIGLFTQTMKTLSRDVAQQW
jgi:hypothetical protein